MSPIGTSATIRLASVFLTAALTASSPAFADAPADPALSRVTVGAADCRFTNSKACR
jgi:hypothetical protein